MRILFLTEISDPGVGSSSRLTFQLAREYEKLGHQCAVVGAVRSAADATPTEIQGIRVFRLHSDYPVRFRAWRSLHNKVIDQPFEDVLAQWKPDLVHAHLIHTHLGYHALTQAKRSGARVVFTAHDVMTFCYQKLTCFHGGEARGGQGCEPRVDVRRAVQGDGPSVGGNHGGQAGAVCEAERGRRGALQT